MDLTDDLIDGLEGLLPAMEVMKQHNLELKGVTTLDMAKNKLRLHQAMQTSSTEMARGPVWIIIDHYEHSKHVTLILYNICTMLNQRRRLLKYCLIFRVKLFFSRISR